MDQLRVLGQTRVFGALTHVKLGQGEIEQPHQVRVFGALRDDKLGHWIKLELLGHPHQIRVFWALRHAKLGHWVKLGH